MTNGRQVEDACDSAFHPKTVMKNIKKVVKEGDY